MTKSYDQMLADKFSNLEINLVRHDTSPTGLPCYIEVKLGSKPKDIGSTILDLSNYLSRTTGLRFQAIPALEGKGKNTVLRWFMTWQDVSPIQENICKALGVSVLAKDYLPTGFRSLIIQNKSRGVLPKSA